jgi:hypothetical protein
VSRKLIDGCPDCDKIVQRSKPLWVLIWPDTGKILESNLGVPSAFFTREAALRHKRNRFLSEPIAVKFHLELRR